MSTVKANAFENISGVSIFDASNSSLHVRAGGMRIAPIRFESGSQLTSAQGGAVEYDGDTLFFTPDSSAVGGRAAMLIPHYYKLPAARTLANDTSTQLLFGVGIALASATTYEFEIFCVVSTSGATSNALNFSVGGTANLTGIEYWALTTNGTAAGTPNTTSSTYFAVTTASTICGAVAAATARVIKINGNVRVTNGGTFIPQIAFSAAPGAAGTVSTGSYIRMTALGTNTVSTIGAWA